MSNVADGDDVLFKRLPILLSVVEGMLEANKTHLNKLQLKNGNAWANTEKSHFIAVITEQQAFVRSATGHCKKLRDTFLKRRQSEQLKKLEDCLKDLADIHTELLNAL